MPTTSTYTFAGATSPIVGSNGNPFGSITTALTINAEGIVSAGYYDEIKTAAGSTIAGFNLGYTFEIKFKSSGAPGSERRLFTPMNSGSGDLPVSITRSTYASGQVIVTHRDATDSTAFSNGFFVYDGAFHIYKFVYNTTTIECFRDNVSIFSSTINAPGTTKNPNLIYIVGTIAGLASDAAPSDLTVEYAYISIGSPYQTRITWAEAQYQASATPTVTDYSSPLSRGIFRGIERGVA